MLGVEQRCADAADANPGIDQVPGHRLTPLARQREFDSRRSRRHGQRQVTLVERVEAANGCLEFHPLTVERARPEIFERRPDRFGQRRASDEGDRGLGNRRREVAGIDPALDANAIAGSDARLDTAHEDENAFFGILDEQERPGRIEKGDDAGDVDVAADRGGVDATDSGDSGQRARCRSSDNGVGRLVRRFGNRATEWRRTHTTANAITPAPAHT